MQNDVFDLKIGNNIYQIDYDHKTGKFTDKELIKSKENIIVCGLHSLYMPDNILNLKIYMDTDDNLRMPWKIKRDIVKRGYTVEKIYKQIIDRKNDYQTYIQIQREKADIIICFYTDYKFDINTFDIDFEPNKYLKIGIKSTYKIDKIINKLKNKINKTISLFTSQIYVFCLNRFNNLLPTRTGASAIKSATISGT